MPAGDQRQGATPATQRQGLGQFVRGHGHGIEDVSDTQVKKILGFFQCRHRDAAGARGDLGGHHFGALVGFDMGAQLHAQAVGTLSRR